MRRLRAVHTARLCDSAAGPSGRTWHACSGVGLSTLQPKRAGGQRRALGARASHDRHCPSVSVLATNGSGLARQESAGSAQEPVPIPRRRVVPVRKPSKRGGERETVQAPQMRRHLPKPLCRTSVVTAVGVWPSNSVGRIGGVCVVACGPIFGSWRSDRVDFP